jgi:hypothetical protein
LLHDSIMQRGGDPAALVVHRRRPGEAGAPPGRRGARQQQIALRLGIAESTVKVHTGNIFCRIGVTDRTSAALWAKEHL